MLPRVDCDAFVSTSRPNRHPTRRTREAIVRLRDAGLLGSVLISQDVFIKIQLVRYGGTGYAHILDHFVPRLRRHGFTEQDI